MKTVQVDEEIVSVTKHLSVPFSSEDDLDFVADEQPVEKLVSFVIAPIDSLCRSNFGNDEVVLLEVLVVVVHVYGQTGVH